MHAAIQLPDFPLEALLRRRPELRAHPCALIDPAQADERARAKAPLLAANQPATAAGTHPGMNAVHALARCPALTLLDRSPTAEQELAAKLLKLSHTLAPRVAQPAPDCLLLDLASLPAARHNPAAWTTSTLASLIPLGTPARLAIAENPQLARLASHSPATAGRLDFDGPEPSIQAATSPPPVQAAQLHPLPLSLLADDLDPDTLQLLQQLGLHTIGDYARLPSAALNERFGRRAQQLHELLHDRFRAPITSTKIPENYSQMVHFEHEITSSTILLFHCKRLLESLAGKLHHHQRAALALRLALGFSAQPVLRRLLRFAAPTADPLVMLRPLQLHLESLDLPAPVSALEVELVAGLPAAAQHQLFERALRDPHRLATTLARLESLLGPDCVGIPLRGDDHRPDSFRLAPFDPGGLAPRPADPCAGVTRPPLPLRRFRPPLALAVAWEEASSRLPQPLALLSGPHRGRIVRYRGPFTLAGHWWEPAAAWRQLEWDLELESGHLLRLAHVPPDAWRLEGEYA